MQNSHLPTVTPKPSRKTKKQTTKPQKRRNKQQKTTKHYSRKAKISKDQNQRSHFATHDRFLPPTTLQNHNAVHDGADHRQWEARVWLLYVTLHMFGPSPRMGRMHIPTWVGCPVAAMSGIPPLQGLRKGATTLLDHHGDLAVGRAPRNGNFRVLICFFCMWHQAYSIH